METFAIVLISLMIKFDEKKFAEESPWTLAMTFFKQLFKSVEEKMRRPEDLLIFKENR